MPLKFRKVLVANRGEIAVRVLRTANKMGLQTVAIFSEADRQSPHVLLADEAVCIGPPPSSESYLKGDEIIRIAKELGVDAIHPGYGFLSENASFARKVTDAGIVFVGPSPESMEIMGSKLAAKAAVKAYGIPMVPGTDSPLTNMDTAFEVAGEIGYPLLIKASAGGGGKGMRVVESEDQIHSQVERAMSEAKAAFGDGSVFLEKYIASPKHIEIQVFADEHGNALSLFERECSVQRRHQKVIEEAPSAVVDQSLRERMGRDAVNVANACNYTGAGTVEFLLDEDGKYYFLEMNTRLQVEHPVTELITGLDLVEWQFRIASGEELPLRQEDLKINGHAIELRVCAEDPENQFLPSIGLLERYRPPKGEGIRVDNGYTEGMEIPIQYDPLLAKLIVHGATRDEAIALMEKAIDNYEVRGVKTTLPFGRYAMAHPAFRSGKFDTHFIDRYYYPDLENRDESKFEQAALLAAKLQEAYIAELKIPHR